MIIVEMQLKLPQAIWMRYIILPHNGELQKKLSHQRRLNERNDGEFSIRVFNVLYETRCFSFDFASKSNWMPFSCVEMAIKCLSEL